MQANIQRRLEKIEKQSEFIKAESDKRQAMLDEIERLEKDDPLRAMFLKAELEYGRKVGIAEMMALLYREKKNDNKNQRNPTK